MKNLFLLTITVLTLASCGSEKEANQGDETNKNTAMETETNKNPTFVIETSMGNIKGVLYKDKAPITVDNFVKLATKGFYNGLIFHRVIPNFMIQTGCPDGTGMGSPGYTIQDEFGEGLKHDKPGVLSMANSGPNTGGSQFFITHVPTQWLDGKHAIFGQVTEGLDVIMAIGNAQKGPGDKPVVAIVMQEVTIN